MNQEPRMSALASAVQFLGGLAFGRMTDQRGGLRHLRRLFRDLSGCDTDCSRMFWRLNRIFTDVSGRQMVLQGVVLLGVCVCRGFSCCMSVGCGCQL